MAQKKLKRSISGLKRIRQSKKHNLVNTAVKSEIKTLVKKLNSAITTGVKEDIHSSLLKATRALSKASSSGVLHKNTSSRKISRISKSAHKVLSS
ncbi:MAG: 30S ribosomal protein S20 [Nitrospirae bacterium]|nr:30S ribosomal protein S20 [Nitrospirota bacterium]